MAILKKIKFGTGTATPIAKTVVQGKPKGVISVTNTSGFNNTDSEEKDYSYDIDVNVDGTTLVKSTTTGDNPVTQLAVGTVPAAQVSVAAGGHNASADPADDKTFVGDDVEEVLLELNEKIKQTGNVARTYTVVDDTANVEDLPTNVLKRYRLQETIGSQSPTLVGANIDIPKDSSLKEVYLGASTDTINATTGVITKNTVTDPQSMNFAYQLANGTYSLTKIDVSKFLTESEFGDGLSVSGAGVVSANVGDGLEIDSTSKAIEVKIDSSSEEDSQTTPAAFLTVGANGIKIQGIKDEIGRKIDALNFIDFAVAGQYVSEVDETDGVISVSRADVSAAKLNNYAKGETKPQSTDIAATDTINQAFAKIEFKIDDNEKTTAASLTDLDNRIKAMDKTASAVDGQVVTTVAEADGVVSETKANVKDLQLGGYAKDASATGAIGGTDTINTALSKLENQIDAAKAAATTKVAKDTNASHLTVTQSAPAADGSVTYTIGESDIASKTDLDAEIAARKAVDGQDGQTYAANTTANYINNATSLNDADVKLDTAIKAEETRAQSAETAIGTAVGLTKASGSETRSFTPTTNYGGTGTSAATSVIDNMQKLDTQLKTVSDSLAGIQYSVSSTELTFYGMTEHA